MALIPNTVGDACATIVAAAAPPAGTSITGAQLKAMWESIAAAILIGAGGVSHGSVAVTVTSVSGVTTGGGVSGPGSGTGVIS